MKWNLPQGKCADHLDERKIYQKNTLEVCNKMKNQKNSLHGTHSQISAFLMFVSVVLVGPMAGRVKITDVQVA
jgi:hypothetical protein